MRFVLHPQFFTERVKVISPKISFLYALCLKRKKVFTTGVQIFRYDVRYSFVDRQDPAALSVFVPLI